MVPRILDEVLCGKSSSVNVMCVPAQAMFASEGMRHERTLIGGVDRSDHVDYSTYIQDEDFGVGRGKGPVILRGCVAKDVCSEMA